MNEAMPRVGKPSFVLTGWHVLTIMLALFGGVFAVNGYMVWHAYSTFPGEVVAKPYEEGLGFNADIRRRADAKAIGWRASLQDTVSHGRLILTIDIHDRNGGAVVGLKPVGQLSRTVTAEGRRVLTFVETGPGQYRAILAPLSGLWELNVKAAAPGQTFELDQRLVWP
jgi:nitrogen fixation protein FixH